MPDSLRKTADFLQAECEKFCQREIALIRERQARTRQLATEIVRQITQSAYEQGREDEFDYIQGQIEQYKARLHNPTLIPRIEP